MQAGETIKIANCVVFDKKTNELNQVPDAHCTTLVE